MNSGKQVEERGDPQPTDLQWPANASGKGIYSRKKREKRLKQGGKIG